MSKFQKLYESIIVETNHKGLVKHFTYMFTKDPYVKKDRDIKKAFGDYFKYTEKDFDAMSDDELNNLWDEYQKLQDKIK